MSFGNAVNYNYKVAYLPLTSGSTVCCYFIILDIYLKNKIFIHFMLVLTLLYVFPRKHLNDIFSGFPPTSDLIPKG